MASLKEIKLKINSTKKTKKITSAMKLVAAAKVNKMQKQIQAARPYAKTVGNLFKQLQKSLNQEQLDANPLLKELDTFDKVLLVVISSDLGLCGAYNANIIKKTDKRIKELRSQNKQVTLLTLGRKARDHFSKNIYKDEHNTEIIKSYTQLPTIPELDTVEEIGNFISSTFITGQFNKVEIISTQFVNMVMQETQLKDFLPIQKNKNDDENEKTLPDIILEPSPEELINTLTPMYLKNTIYTNMLDSTTSELASRMTAMSNATSNADSVISKLVLQFNKARQAAITQELTEIVAGSSAI